MNLLASTLVVVVALLHLWFLVLEMFLWTTPYGRRAFGLTPEKAARRTGVAPETIARLATEIASARRAVAYGRVGVCHNTFSATASYLIEALNVLTGNFDREGGAMFPTPAIELSGVARMLGIGGAGRFRSRVRGLPEMFGELPTVLLEFPIVLFRCANKFLHLFVGFPRLKLPFERFVGFVKTVAAPVKRAFGGAPR